MLSDELKQAYRATPGSFGRERSKNSKGLTFANLLKMQIYGLDYSYATELNEFFNGDMSLPPKQVAAPSSLCEARSKIKHEAFIDLNDTLINAYYQNAVIQHWHGFRIIAVDGTTVHVPDTPDNVEYFGGWDSAKSDPGDICPKARVSFAYDPINKLIVDAIMAPTFVGEDSLARQHLQKSSPNDLNLYDRGYASYRLFRLHEDAGVHYCARIPTKLFTKLCADFIDSDENDCIVNYAPQGLSRSSCVKEGLSVECLRIRLVKVKLSSGEIEILATNIFDHRLSAKSFGDLYHLRWGVEEEYKRLKCRVEIESFSGKKTEFVHQDFYADIIRLNITTLIAMEARTTLQKQGKKDKHVHAPNMSFVLSQMTIFLDALFESDESTLQRVMTNLTAHFIKRSEPIRPGRNYPRQKKPERSGYSMPYKRAS